MAPMAKARNVRMERSSGRLLPHSWAAEYSSVAPFAKPLVDAAWAGPLVSSDLESDRALLELARVLRANGNIF